MFGLNDDIQEYRHEIDRLKSEKKALVECIKLLLSDANNPGLRELAETLVRLEKSKRD